MLGKLLKRQYFQVETGLRMKIQKKSMKIKGRARSTDGWETRFISALILACEGFSVFTIPLT
jgi:hypothetical protein